MGTSNYSDGSTQRRDDLPLNLQPAAAGAGWCLRRLAQVDQSPDARSFHLAQRGGRLRWSGSARSQPGSGNPRPNAGVRCCTRPPMRAHLRGATARRAAGSRTSYARWPTPAADHATPYRERAAPDIGSSCDPPRQSDTPAVLRARTGPSGARPPRASRSASSFFSFAVSSSSAFSRLAFDTVIPPNLALQL